MLPLEDGAWESRQRGLRGSAARRISIPATGRGHSGSWAEGANLARIPGQVPGHLPKPSLLPVLEAHSREGVGSTAPSPDSDQARPSGRAHSPRNASAPHTDHGSPSSSSSQAGGDPGALRDPRRIAVGAWTSELRLRLRSEPRPSWSAADPLPKQPASLICPALPARNPGHPRRARSQSSPDPGRQNPRSPAPRTRGGPAGSLGE